MSADIIRIYLKDKGTYMAELTKRRNLSKTVDHYHKKKSLSKHTHEHISKNENLYIMNQTYSISLNVYLFTKIKGNSRIAFLKRNQILH